MKQSGYEKDYKYKEDRLTAMEKQKESSLKDLRLLEKGLLDEKNLAAVAGTEMISWDRVSEGAEQICQLLQASYSKKKQ